MCGIGTISGPASASPMERATQRPPGHTRSGPTPGSPGVAGPFKWETREQIHDVHTMHTPLVCGYRLCISIAFFAPYSHYIHTTHTPILPAGGSQEKPLCSLHPSDAPAPAHCEDGCRRGVSSRGTHGHSNSNSNHADPLAGSNAPLSPHPRTCRGCGGWSSARASRSPYPTPPMSPRCWRL